MSDPIYMNLDEAQTETVLASSALSPEEERAAIVAYTGLWQLLVIDPESESETARAARLELRGRLDASDAAAVEEGVSVDA